MPSFDNSSSQTYDASSRISISEMNYDECEAEKLRIRNRIEHLRGVQAANTSSGMDRGGDTNEALEQRIVDLEYRFQEVESQISALDAQYHAVVPQNTGYGSTSRNRSSQSPPAPRAPNTSPQR
ncbi:hypothetical protein BCON_0063g00100 [Botryotinia convoluta]|uniref:REM-1 domain-containing protein n=1 Tax=Botryotinia convoluta TaxID=54673 RepID=A0A4Z1ILR1_9HELO|nr:hypothetical protein BCON_0063g00100 [Botryotinia convoluta]